MGTAGRSDLVLPETASLSQQKSQIILCSSRDGRNSETPWGGYWALLGVLCNRLVCEEGVSAGGASHRVSEQCTQLTVRDSD